MNIFKVVENIEELLKQAEMIGIGSTRKVYRFEDIVIKTFYIRSGMTKVKMNLKCTNSWKCRVWKNILHPYFFE